MDLTKGERLEDTFDIIYAVMALHHVKDIPAILQSFYQHLNPGGKIFVADLNEEGGAFHREDPTFDGHNGFNPEKLLKVFEETGFKKCICDTFFYGEKRVFQEDINYSLFSMVGQKL